MKAKPRDIALEYADLGFDSLPLHAGTKEPIFKDWRNRDPLEMWEYAPEDSNVGLRCGGDARLAVIDADDKNDPRSSQNVIGYMAMLGYAPNEYPMIATPSGGRHIYITFAGALPDHWRKLDRTIGAGEFRYGSGAQVATPPSIVEGNAYRLIAGDWRQLPKLTLDDVLPLLANKETEAQPARPNIPRLAWRVLMGNAETIHRYESRSEAEQAAILSLINSGHSFENVLSLFMHNRGAGKFQELYAQSAKRAIGYLQHSYTEAQKIAARETEGRKIANAAIEWATSRAWSGRTGSVDRVVFIAHATIAQRSGKEVYAASSRTIAEAACIESNRTAINSTRRLISAGLLTKHTRHTVTLSPLYCLTGLDYTLPKNPTVRKCVSLAQHDAFRNRYLGKAGAELWGLLVGETLTAKKLAELTGRKLRTVKRKLDRMSRIVDPKTGEVFSMVECVDGKWRACDDVDIDFIARLLGSEGAAKRQRERHNAERRAHKQDLKLGERKKANVEDDIKAVC